VEVQLEQEARDSDDDRAPRQLTARSRRCVSITASLHTLCVGAVHGVGQSLTMAILVSSFLLLSLS